MAKALGARVYQGNKVEIGFYDDVYLTPQAKSLFCNFSDPIGVFHWHSDTFDLPQGATRLAYSQEYQNQAFEFGSGVGIQFHLEVDANMITLWLDNTHEKLEQMRIDVQKIKHEIPKKVTKVNDNLENFYLNFKSKFDL